MTVRFEDDPIPSPAPKAGTSATSAIVQWIGLAVVVGVLWWSHQHGKPQPIPTPTPTPVPVPTPDPTPTPTPQPQPEPSSPWVRLGREYTAALGREYAACWRTFAADIDRTWPVADSSQAMAKEWASRRENLFREKLSPELQKLYPEPVAGKEETVPTPEQREALSKACRELADGLEGK